MRSPIIASDARVPTEDAAFLRAVLEAIPAFVVRLDPELRVRYINHLREGVTLDQVIGQPVRNLIAAEDFASFERAAAEALRTGRSCAYVARGSRAVRRDGAASYEAHAVPIDNGDGQRAICIIASDVSEDRARAIALEQSEQQLRLAVEATGIGLWTWDMVHDRIEWSERMTEMAGCEPMPIREYMARFIHPGDRARMERELSAARDGTPVYLEHRVIRPDGEVRWFLPCGRMTFDEHGRAIRMIGGMLDVTAQRMLDEQSRKSQRLDAIGCLTAGVTHNFNNMLAAIMPNIELALRTASGAQAEMLQDALHSARRAAELVAQLMTFSGQRGVAAAEPHDFAPLVLNAISICRGTFGANVRIVAMIETECVVACIPSAIEQVIVNLLINARDAVLAAERDDPCIQVQLLESQASDPTEPFAAPKRCARIRVRDNGLGMSDDVKQHLFEPFFTTKGPGKGTGLGLATSYGILRDHGGTISLESERGVGTVAEISLPILERHQVSSRAITPRPVVSRGTILVADDEPAIQRVLGVLLRERGHEVHEAGSGEDVIALLDAGVRPHLILLDHAMPGWPAKKTVDAIRQRFAALPIVFFTGHDVAPDAFPSVQGVLYKPLNAEELLQSIERWLRAE